MTRTDPAAYWYDMWYAERCHNAILEGCIDNALRETRNFLSLTSLAERVQRALTPPTKEGPS